MSTRSQPVPSPGNTGSVASGHPRLGRIVRADPGGPVLVDYPGNPSGPLAARVLSSVPAHDLERAAAIEAPALLVFEEGDGSLPIVTGLLASPTPHLDVALAEMPDEPRVALLDGRRVVLDGREEIVLKCGKSSLTLRRDGKVVLRGVTIVTDASGVQRIRGGKVQIN